MSGDTLEHCLLLALVGLGLVALILFGLLAFLVLQPWFSHPGSFPLPASQIFSTPTVNLFPTITARTATRTPYRPQPGATRTPRPPRTSLPTLTATLTAFPTASREPTRIRKPTRVPSTSTPAKEPPEEAYISGVEGYAQISTLDCEARSAVDWAAFFGVEINEYEFLDTLPSSDNPETGFVGVYWDVQGRIPPASYGVHAPPVAALLRVYGLQAYDGKYLAWQDVQREVAAGRPVIAWVVGNVLSSGRPETYTTEDGQTVAVARFEHTVIVTGYDRRTVTVVDGNRVYTRGLDTFLDSWSVLNNMAITAGDLSN